MGRASKKKRIQLARLPRRNTQKGKHFNLYGANPKATIYCRDSLVVPLAIMGPEKILPLGSFLPHPATVRLRVGDPIEHSEVEETCAENIR